jgi:hypothetical protein
MRIFLNTSAVTLAVYYSVLCKQRITKEKHRFPDFIFVPNWTRISKILHSSLHLTVVHKLGLLVMDSLHISIDTLFELNVPDIFKHI